MHRGISPENLNDLFSLRQTDQYNLRNRSQFIIPNVKIVNQSFESLKHLGPKIWETIPTYLKEIDSLKNFKDALKIWKAKLLTSRLFYAIF